ncbi:MAG: hypothetical protein HY080_08335 [Gammaproteobacteria bacterium]|nr:hypothetical protein [Gammaproteobacteria bacterium]
MPSIRFMPMTLVWLVCLTSVGCQRLTKEETLDIACAKSIKSANELLDRYREHLEKDQLSQTQNLIAAAQIDQGQKHFPACEDKAQRALHLVSQYGRSP